MNTLNLALIPSPPQGVWHVGPIPLRAYALCIIAGILVALWLSKKRYVARGGDPAIIDEAALVIVPAGIIGGRIYHVLTDHEKYFCADCNPWDVFKITNGGLGILGAVVLGGLGVWALMRYRKLPLGPLADSIAPGLILAQGIGRLGNWFNQELYGRPTDVPWGLEIYRRVDATGALAPLNGHSDGHVLAVVHPTFLYELVWNVAVCVALILIDRRFRLGRGSVFVAYVVAYSFGRFFVELMRSDAATLLFGFRVNSVMYTVLFVVFLAIFVLMRKWRETPEQVRGEQPLRAPTATTTDPATGAATTSTNTPGAQETR
ncbi:prolipoprotein diacylglyceryl transferase [Corynebacterium aquilae]|uniref:prolipoprotein diacylglyceryl transferase n=1 Tax=Corynebacterium aquilae TaxID=203263 RepID=UPI000950F0C3|nr:prolipoprotein diacylglyceryl transferase [Corynebacterium aquilae]